MLLPESRTSTSSFCIAGVINGLTGGFDYLPEDRIADRLFGEQIDWPAEKMLQGVGEIKVSIISAEISLKLQDIL